MVNITKEKISNKQNNLIYNQLSNESSTNIVVIDMRHKSDITINNNTESDEITAAYITKFKKMI